MAEIEPGHRRARPHRKALGQLDAGGVLGVEQRKQRRLLGVIGLRGIAGRGTDAGILLEDQLVRRRRLVRRIAPEFAAHAGVHPLGKGLGETIGQRLAQDRGVIVIGVLEAVGDHVLADPGGDHEGADIIGYARGSRRDEVRQRRIETAFAFFQLLAQRVEGRDLLLATIVGIHGDIVALRIGGPEPDGGARGEPLFLDDALQHLARVVIE